MSFADSVAWSDRVRDPNNGHTWTLMGDQTGGLLVRCAECTLLMTAVSLGQICSRPHHEYESRRAEPVPDPRLREAAEQGYAAGNAMADALAHFGAQLGGYLAALDHRSAESRRLRNRQR